MLEVSGYTEYNINELDFSVRRLDTMNLIILILVLEVFEYIEFDTLKLIILVLWVFGFIEFDYFSIASKTNLSCS